MKIDLNDEIALKKNHPCGSNIFAILKLGSDIKLKCKNCDRVLWIKRSDLNNRILKINGKKY